MPRFILIDPALVELGGHYYEYARAVATAAERSGYEVIVAGHRCFRSPADGWSAVRPVYRDGLWRHQSGSVRIRYCDLGNALLRRLGGALRAIRRQSGIGKPESGLGRLLMRTHRLQDSLCAQRFMEDTARFMQDVRPTEDDLVLIPNMSRAMARGLARYFTDNPGTASTSWHLVFHTTLFLDEPESEGTSPLEAELMWEALQQLYECGQGWRLTCYTDTDNLTKQYNSLGPFKFRTICIPVTPQVNPSAGHRAGSGPLRIVFLGDARSTKGYHCLPELVEAVWEDLVQPGRVRFIFQSYYARKWPDWRSLSARRRLRCWQTPHVELIESPLTSADYHALLADADIVLLPYESRLYTSQSSSIFAEALAAGKPVVVPEGTWMAEQVEAAGRIGQGTRPVSSRETSDGMHSSGRPVGAVYTRGRSHIADAVRTIVHSYEDYRSSAAKLSRDWSRRHHAVRLVRQLDEDSTAAKIAEPPSRQSGSQNARTARSGNEVAVSSESRTEGAMILRRPVTKE